MMAMTNLIASIAIDLFRMPPKNADYITSSLSHQIKIRAPIHSYPTSHIYFKVYKKYIYRRAFDKKWLPFL